MSGLSKHYMYNHIHLVQMSLEMLREDICNLPMPDTTRQELIAWLDRIPKLDQGGGRPSLKAEDNKMEKELTSWIENIVDAKKGDGAGHPVPPDLTPKNQP